MSKKPEDRKEVVPMMFPSEMVRRGPGGNVPETAAPEPESRPAAAGAEPAGSGAGLSLRLENRDRPAAPPRVFVFRQEQVTIGRSGSCELQLDDEQRIVSGQHARIVARGDGFEVSDLGSKNLTYLNGYALEPNRPHGLAPGDVLEIGRFTIHVALAEEATVAARAPDETVLAPEFVNPFREDAAELAELVARIAERYDLEAPGRREAALEAALEEALSGRAAGEALEVIGRALARLADRTEPAD